MSTNNSSTSDRWTNYFLSIADVAAKQSKDPSSKVGAVIADPADRVISTGFNGPPRGVKDDSDILADRKLKLQITLHAEANAILFAKRDLTDCIIYTTHAPCAQCAALIIQSGITSVIAGEEAGSEFTDRWADSIDVAKRIFKEAGVKFRRVLR